MGFIIFSESGTFNPIDYGLSIGDTINLMVIGGGGGGGAYYCNNPDYPYFSLANGGTGGSSSFGSYLTAAGGACTGTGTPSVYGYKGGSPAVLSNISGVASGGGAGGWIPGCPVWGGNGGNASVKYNNNCYVASGTPLTYIIPYESGLGGYGGRLESNQFTYYYSGTNSTQVYYQQFKYENPSVYKPCYLNVYCTGSSSNIGFGGGQGVGPQAGGGGGCSLCNLGGGVGGSGYGAGGGGGGFYYSSSYMGGGYGGNSGEIRMTSFVLSSISSIAVGVGGGGSGVNSQGSSFVTAPTANSGSTGGYGASNGSGGRGGYGTAKGANASNAYSGGGGASGCVTVFW